MTRKRGNGSIYRQPNCSKWTISYYTWGKRVRESTGTDDYRAAQQKLHERLVAIAKDEPIEPRRRQQILISELYEGLTRHYRNNERKSLDAVERRWKHLKPFFAERPARNVTYDLLEKYVDKRRETEKAANASINRELAALKTMLRLGAMKRKFAVPLFPHLEENNVRQGFIEQADFNRLRDLATEPWLRLFLEIAFEYGWRKQEILSLRVRQVNLQTRLIRLDVGSTKNNEGREVTMSKAVRELVRLAVSGKNPNDYLLTRMDGKPVKDFRKAWKNLCEKAGLDGLYIHDFRRSAARELRRAGVSESTIMDIGGWKTRQMFKRYAIKDPKDIAAAISKREQQANSENGHDFSHDSASDSQQGAVSANARIQ